VEPAASATDRFDIIFVLASFAIKTLAYDELRGKWLRQADRDKAVLCGIEGGTEILAAAGLLKGSRVASHWDHVDAFQELYPGTEAGLALYVVDGRRRLSCAGGAAVLDLMFRWLRPRLEPAIFSQLTHHMLETRLRAG